MTRDTVLKTNYSERRDEESMYNMDLDDPPSDVTFFHATSSCYL
jgi:hypothetical protein